MALPGDNIVSSGFYNPLKKPNAFTLGSVTNSSYTSPSGGTSLTGLGADNYASNPNRFSNPNNPSTTTPKFVTQGNGFSKFIGSNGGKILGGISGTLNAAGSIVTDADTANQIHNSNVNDYIQKSGADPMGGFQKHDNPYMQIGVGTEALKYAGAGATIGSSFGPWGCVCAGTKVVTNSGEFKNIEDLKQKDGIIGWDGNNFIQQPINHFQPPAKKECIEIETQLGHVLRCSTDHPIYSSGKGRAVRQKTKERARVKTYQFVDADKLTIGDRVGLIDEIPIWGNKEMPYPYLIGLLIGDGSYGEDHPVRVNSIDKDTWDYLEKNNISVQSNFDWVKRGYNLEFREYRILDGTILLRELGIYGQANQDKRLPTSVHEYDKASICAMIAGLIDSDGYVSFDKNKSKDGHIGFCQVSIELIKEVRNQLIKLGVHSSLRKNKAKTSSIRGRVVNSKDCYRLIIKDKISVLNFASCISLNISYKKENLKNLCEYISSIPSRDNVHLSKAKSDSIVRITSIGLQDIYNLEAGGSHTYIANMIITHNTLIGGAVGGIGGTIEGAVRHGDIANKQAEFNRNQENAHNDYMNRYNQYLDNQQRTQLQDYQAKQYQNAYVNPYLV